MVSYVVSKNLGFYGGIVLGTGVFIAGTVIVGEYLHINSMDTTYWQPAGREIATARKLNKVNPIDSQEVALLCNETDALLSKADRFGAFNARESPSKKALELSTAASKRAAKSVNDAMKNELAGMSPSDKSWRDILKPGLISMSATGLPKVQEMVQTNNEKIKTGLPSGVPKWQPPKRDIRALGKAQTKPAGGQNNKMVRVSIF